MDLPEVEVVEIKTDREGDLIVVVRSTRQGTHCRACGQWIDKPWGHDREITLRHLPILGKRTFIVLQPPRFECRNCPGRPTTTQQLPWYERKRRYTKAFEEHVLLALVNATVADVSHKEQVGYDAVLGILEHALNRKDVDWAEHQDLDKLGLDEITLLKGHRDFITIVSGRANGETRILAVLPDRTKETVKAFLETIPQDLRKRIGTVCSDLYEGFMEAAREVFPRSTRLVADRFHVAKLYRKGLDTLRKQELRRLKEALPEHEYAKLKGAMWALRKKAGELDDEESGVLRELFRHSQRLEAAYYLSGLLTRIFDSPISKRSASARIRHWARLARDSGVGCFDTFLKTLGKWKDEITNYFIDRSSSGFVEGLNNKIKVIKRRCYGILNIQ
ncbi:MAG: ISL3 family transposase, partial [bacterium]|nr:ISL3 family transposase [bacterium]